MIYESISWTCRKFAKKQGAHTVHETWIVVGLKTTGLCNRTMTSPSSFCTCLWSTPWAGGLISKEEENIYRYRERHFPLVYYFLYMFGFITMVERKKRWLNRLVINTDGDWLTQLCVYYMCIHIKVLHLSDMNKRQSRQSSPDVLLSALTGGLTD